MTATRCLRPQWWRLWVASVLGWASAARPAAAAGDQSRGRRLRDDRHPTFPYGEWSGAIKARRCGSEGSPLVIEIRSVRNEPGSITCALVDGKRLYKFPAGVFQIDEQLLVPENTAILGAKNPNDMSEPTKTPDWKQQTLFLATRGVTDFSMNYCHAQDMVTTRVGFVLSSHVTVSDVSYQGIDTIRPRDNAALCGGGAFETKGCAENDCGASGVNNGGSDGIGSVDVTIERVRLNDYYFAEDRHLVGAAVPGNRDCGFCRPNGVRSSQVGVWVPASRNPEGSQRIVVRDVVSSSTQGDGVNLHGRVDSARVQSAYFRNTGDDVYALWGAQSNPTNIVFQDCVAENPGILRPNWYGNCVATYGLKSALFKDLTCRAPTLEHPIPMPHSGLVAIDTSMFVFYHSFGAGYPEGNTVTIEGWTFEDMEGRGYTPGSGSRGRPEPGKMAWTKADNGVVAPYYVVSDASVQINVVAME